MAPTPFLTTQTELEWVDQLGSEIFPDTWTGKEIRARSPLFAQDLKPAEEAAFHRWQTALSNFHSLLETGELIPAKSSLSDRSQQLYVRARLRPQMVRKKLRPGPAARADWEAYRMVFFEKCEQDGLPREEGNMWGTKSMAIKWLQDLVEKDTRHEFAPSFETARGYVDKWIGEYPTIRGKGTRLPNPT